MTCEAVLIVETHGHVRVLRLNRPDKLNALDSALTRALRDELQAAASDETVRAIVLCGAGRAFCAGADVAEMKARASLTPDEAKQRSETSFELYGLVARHPKPIVAAIHGATVGAGAAIALSCDLVVAAAGVKLSFPEIRHGMLPGIVMPVLQRHFGLKMGFELISTARQLGADDLVALGVANRRVEADGLLDEAFAIARSWAEAPPAVMAATKALFHEVADMSFADALVHARDANARLKASRKV